MDTDVEKFIDNLKTNLNLDGRKRVFEDGEVLQSSHLIEKADPEAVTKEFIIEPLARKLNLEKLPEKHFQGIRGEQRKVDYRLRNNKKLSFLLEAKPVNTDLFDKSPDGGVNQIKGLFRLAEVKEGYEFGIATDGIQWIFIDKSARIAYHLSITKDFSKIKEILTGEKEVSVEKIEEEISKKFYVWYNALLHGGSYKDHNNKTKRISANDCLVKNILFVDNSEDKERIAQTILDRLIFIKFLQSKGIIGQDILEYLSELDENRLNDELKQLFFTVLNTEKSKRIDVNIKFKEIPYLNGSLFLRTDIEIRNPDYKIKARILNEVIKFLDSFKFVHLENSSKHQTLDPEILGYIFEKAMTAGDRKGTGAYYTPKMITQFISQNTIYPRIIEETNNLLKQKGSKETKLVTTIDELFELKPNELREVLNNVLIKIKICDDACGSGAFLLAAAGILLEIYEKINQKLNLGLSEIELRKIILKNSLYGVDSNPNAIEIAKLRLWLWLVTAYEPNRVEPLPNIDYNLRVGNSLIGYADVSKFKEQKLNLNDWLSEPGEESLNLLLVRRSELIRNYKDSTSDNAKELREKIEESGKKIRQLLDLRFHQELLGQKIRLEFNEFQKLKPFHWGFEFPEVFGSLELEENGFDLIIGNPPYGNILKNAEKKMIIKFETSNASEIAANFIERCLEITRKNGQIGLIVANAIAINASTHKARELIRKKMSTSKMALFGTRPAKIFADAEIRVLILFGSKDCPDKPGVILTTEAI
ncbi:N-6 DNA methylase, partial [Candidatus Micrarchaeota archaeon]|nr:N-6 DNA methylase [Candidatus Micrarchaeota archaeon]